MLVTFSMSYMIRLCVRRQPDSLRGRMLSTNVSFGGGKAEVKFLSDLGGSNYFVRWVRWWGVVLGVVHNLKLYLCFSW